MCTKYKLKGLSWLSKSEQFTDQLEMTLIVLNGPENSKSNQKPYHVGNGALLHYADSDGPVQPVHPRSLIKNFDVRRYTL